MRKALFARVALAALTLPLLGSVVASTAPAQAATPAFGGVLLNGFESRLVTDMNAARHAAGLGPLAVAGGTTELARSWAEHLAAVGTLSHNPNLLTGLETHGSYNWTFAAENVGYGPASSADTLFNAYMNSAPHRANILAPEAHFVGVGAVATAAGVEFNTIDFVDSYSGALALTSASPATPSVQVSSVPAPAPGEVNPAAGLAQYTTMANGGSWVGRPYLAPTTLGTVVRFAARAGAGGGVALIVHKALNLTGASTLRLRIAGENRYGKALPVLVLIATAHGLVGLGEVWTVPATRWVSLTLPAAARTVAYHTVLYIPAAALAGAGGWGLVALGPAVA